VIVALAVLAGGLGAVARFVVDGVVKARFGDRVPWGTLLINVTGSLALGVLTGLVIHRGGPDDVRVVLGTGFCGGYTTFSTASVETVRLVQRRAPWTAVAYAAGTAAAAITAAALGLALTA
jgi:CrcB protein